MNTKTKSLKLQICDRILNEQGGALTPKETPQQKAAREKSAREKAAREKAAAEKKAVAAKDKTVVANSDISEIDPAKIAHYNDIFEWTKLTVGTLLLAALAGKALNKLVGIVAKNRGITKGNAVRWMIKDGITSSLAGGAAKFFNWDKLAMGIENNATKIENSLAKTKTDDEMIKRTGLTRAEGRVIIDEIGTVDWNMLAKQFESQARLEYYKDGITLNEYMIAAGYAGNPTSKKIAETWMPIIKKAATGQMQFVKLNTINDIEKFKDWFKQASSWSHRYWSKFPELKDMSINLRTALASKGQPMFGLSYKPEAVTYVADRINKIISNTPAVSDDILNIANTTNSFPPYKKWSAIQTITKNKADVNTYLRQKFCWYAQKHSI